MLFGGQICCFVAEQKQLRDVNLELRLIVKIAKCKPRIQGEGKKDRLARYKLRTVRCKLEIARQKSQNTEFISHNYGEKPKL